MTTTSGQQQITTNGQKYTSTETCANCSFTSTFDSCDGTNRVYKVTSYTPASTDGNKCYVTTTSGQKEITGNEQKYTSTETCANCSFTSAFDSCDGTNRVYKVTSYTPASTDGNNDKCYVTTTGGQQKITTNGQTYTSNETCNNCEGYWDSGNCSVLCGGGNQTLTFHVTKQPSNGGTCQYNDGYQTSQSCNNNKCDIKKIKYGTNIDPNYPYPIMNSSNEYLCSASYNLNFTKKNGTVINTTGPVFGSSVNGLNSTNPDCWSSTMLPYNNTWYSGNIELHSDTTNSDLSFYYTNAKNTSWVYHTDTTDIDRNADLSVLAKIVYPNGESAFICNADCACNGNNYKMMGIYQNNGCFISCCGQKQQTSFDLLKIN